MSEQQLRKVHEWLEKIGATDIQYPLREMSELDLSNRNIYSVPPEISSMISLRRLDLSNNQIETLPDEITSLKLEYFDIRRNPVRISSDRLLDWVENIENYYGPEMSIDMCCVM